ncbi:hypothetical protein HanXRQr2_Chr12g0524141 [Helianthus annuus]|uniref:Uncharacterized protein n=1 Tax=Helianthus annuus TaxID=4232 RepID=A0A9K3HD22_HELAN|nr:hypothetical protein HanXRQr2_Chr12g0524141 [Helianthus annuus]
MESGESVADVKSLLGSPGGVSGGTIGWNVPSQGVSADDVSSLSQGAMHLHGCNNEHHHHEHCRTRLHCSHLWCSCEWSPL